MYREILLTLAAVFVFVGCTQASSPLEKQEKQQGIEEAEQETSPGEQSQNIPAYDITLEQDCSDTGVVAKCYSISTDATSTEDLEVVTADLWLNSPEYLAILVTFYPNKQTSDISGTGFAFKNDEAARVVLKQASARGASVEDEVREAMANGGIYVISIADEVREFTEDTTGSGSEPGHPYAL